MRSALSAQPRARRESDALLLGRERHGRHALVCVAELDQALVACIGHIRHLPHALRLERHMNRRGPVDHLGGGRFRFFPVHYFVPIKQPTLHPENSGIS
jgi:hypothetical protein